MISIAHPLGRVVLVSPPVLPDDAPLAPLVEIEPPLPPIEWSSALELLLPEERLLFDALAPARRPTFLAGRVALCRALEGLGAPRAPITADLRGAPVLPIGWSGSIAHKPMLAGAVASAFSGAHLGIDVELLRAPRVAIGPRVLTVAELAEGGDETLSVMGRFAIKEAIYKAIDRSVGRYVGFREAELLELAVPPVCALDALTFVSTRAVMTMAKGEGPFEVEAQWARTAHFAIALARVRSA